MQIKLALNGQHMDVTLPPMPITHPLFDAVGSSGIPLYLDDLWKHFSQTNEWTVPVPLSMWRDALGRLEGGYARRVEVRREDDEQCPVFAALTFEYAGQQYSRVGSLPLLGQEEVKGRGFSLTQQVLRVSDPGSPRDSEHAFTLNARPGQWQDHALTLDGLYGQELIALLVLHADVSRETLDFDDFVDSGSKVYVNSGQCGFFDDARYPDNPYPRIGEPTPFYSQACEITCGAPRDYPLAFGTLDASIGVVAHPMDGDGRYPCGVLYDEAGLVVGAMLWLGPEPDVREESDAAD